MNPDDIVMLDAVKKVFSSQIFSVSEKIEEIHNLFKDKSLFEQKRWISALISMNLDQNSGVILMAAFEKLKVVVK